MTHHGRRTVDVMGRDELNRLSARLRGHHWWRGVGRSGWYLWRQRTSPPDVHRYPTRAELVAEMRERAAAQDRWDAEHN